MVSPALRGAENAEVHAEGTVACGVGGPVDADDRLAEGTGEVEGAGVSGDGERDAAGDGDESGDGGGDGAGLASGFAFNGCGERFLAGSGVDDHAATLGEEGTSHGGVTLDGPALGSPAGAGVDEDGGGTCGGEQFLGPGLGDVIYGEQRADRREQIAGDGLGEFDVLFDYMRAGGRDPLVGEPAGGALAGLPLAVKEARTAERMDPWRSRAAS